MWNGAWNKLQFKVCQVAHASMAYLDKHSTLWRYQTDSGRDQDLDRDR